MFCFWSKTVFSSSPLPLSWYWYLDFQTVVKFSPKPVRNSHYLFTPPTLLNFMTLSRSFSPGQQKKPGHPSGESERERQSVNPRTRSETECAGFWPSFLPEKWVLFLLSPILSYLPVILLLLTLIPSTVSAPLPTLGLLEGKDGYLIQEYINAITAYGPGLGVYSKRRPSTGCFNQES